MTPGIEELIATLMNELCNNNWEIQEQPIFDVYQDGNQIKILTGDKMYILSVEEGVHGKKDPK